MASTSPCSGTIVFRDNWPEATPAAPPPPRSWETQLLQPPGLVKDNREQGAYLGQVFGSQPVNMRDRHGAGVGVDVVYQAGATSWYSMLCLRKTSVFRGTGDVGRGICGNHRTGSRL
ncbi:unnamed protein product [Boreogadus saida]